MSIATKKLKYEEFMHLSPEQRQQQSDYFRKSRPDFVPVVLCKRSPDLPDLPNCKFLINLKNEIFAEINCLRSHIIKNCQGKLNGIESLYFMHNKKLLNSNMKVSQFMNKNYKNLEKDGWFHIIYSKEQTF